MKSWSQYSNIRVVIMVAVLGTGLVQEALASCGSGDRVAYENAECLTAWWKNGAFKSLFLPFATRGSTYSARNECEDWGRVVVKWDLKDTSDKTWHLDDGNRRDGQSSYHKVNWAYCCSDLSDLCNQSDMLTDDGCQNEFNDSTAYSDGCRLESATYVAESSGPHCDISATCPSGPTSMDTSGTWHFLQVDHLVNCNGELKRHDEYCGAAAQVSETNTSETNGRCTLLSPQFCNWEPSN